MSPWSHRAGCGDASIVVLSLWSENSAKLALFCVHGYSFGFTNIRQKSFVFIRHAHAQIATAWYGGILGKYGGIFGNYGGILSKYDGILGKYGGIFGKYGGILG